MFTKIFLRAAATRRSLIFYERPPHNIPRSAIEEQSSHTATMNPSTASTIGSRALENVPGDASRNPFRSSSIAKWRPFRSFLPLAKASGGQVPEHAPFRSPGSGSTVQVQHAIHQSSTPFRSTCTQWSSLRTCISGYGIILLGKDYGAGD